jgi:hypothetical protein
MKQWCELVLCSLLVLLVCSSAPPAVAEPAGQKLDLPDPPLPSRVTPVDYVTFIDDLLGKVYDLPACSGQYEILDRVQRFDGDWWPFCDDPWTSNDDLERWLRQNRRALERFAEAVSGEECRLTMRSMLKAAREVYEEDPDAFLIPTGYRSACRGLLAECYHNFEPSKAGELLDRAVVVLRWSDRFDTLGSSVAQVHNFDASLRAFRALQHALQLSADPSAFADQHVSKVLEMIPPRPHPELAAYFDWVDFYSVWQEGETIAGSKGNGYRQGQALLRVGP